MNLKNLNLKFLNITFDTCPTLLLSNSFYFKFSKYSKIQFLSLSNCDIKIFNYEDFSEFLKNTNYLTGFKFHLKGFYKFDWNLIHKTLSFNKSLKVIDLDDRNLSSFSSEIIKFILSNKLVITLILRGFKIEINLEFIDAYQKSNY